MSSREERTGPDTLTVAAIAAAAGALSVFLHEFVGHGGFCVLTGGHMVSVSSFDFNCSTESRWMMAGGTIVNAAAGAVAWFWQRRLRPGHLRFFLWALMALSWLDAAGYFLYSGIAGFGDWYNVIAGVRGVWAWRVAMAIFGALMYWQVVVAIVRELKAFLPAAAGVRRPWARSYMLGTYFAFGIVQTIAGVFNPLGWRLMLAAAMAGSFGGASGLAWGWQYVRAAGTTNDAPALARHWGWIGAGAATAAVYIFVLGPSVRL